MFHSNLLEDMHPEQRITIRFVDIFVLDETLFSHILWNLSSGLAAASQGFKNLFTIFGKSFFDPCKNDLVAVAKRQMLIDHKMLVKVFVHHLINKMDHCFVCVLLS